ncbi:MAG: glycosyltransferase family 2 protein [Rhodospirillaceae bacterium]|nr:glycosyltransferase family 2 protein [Rhodospirillaceae bacterium]
MSKSILNPQFELAVVVPVHNEELNIRPLVEEIAAALDGKTDYQIVYVDDGSRDKTPERLLDLAKEHPRMCIVRQINCCGQSAAVATGVKSANAKFIATLDGDGQNDPADIPSLLDTLKNADDADLLLVAGWRTKRKDTEWKRLQSRIANAVRSKLLGDETPDTGCGLKVFTRLAFLDMPRFDHMHRFLPALMIRRGGKVISVKVNHRQRERGISKYGMWGRLKVGIVDIFGVMWLRSRGSKPQIEIVRASKSGPKSERES